MKVKWWATKSVKVFVTHKADKELVSRIYIKKKQKQKQTTCPKREQQLSRKMCQ